MNKLEFQKQLEKGNTNFTLRICNITNNKLKEISKETGISRNSIINKMILFGLKNYKIYNDKE